jgi:hypothetical protein
MTGMAMLALLALVAGACGGDDDSSSDTTEASDDGGTTDDGATTTDDGGSTDDDGGTDAAVGLGLVDEDCQFLLAGAYLSPLAALVPGADAEEYQENAEQLEAIADKAPEEIQDAMSTLTAAWAEMQEALQDVDFSDVQSLMDPETQEKFEDLESVFDEEYDEASQTVSDYAAENCSG